MLFSIVFVIIVSLVYSQHAHSYSVCKLTIRMINVRIVLHNLMNHILGTARCPHFGIGSVSIVFIALHLGQHHMNSCPPLSHLPFTPLRYSSLSSLQTHF